MAIEYKGFFDRKTMMKQWDSWHSYISERSREGEPCASWPTDAFEAMLDYCEDRLREKDWISVGDRLPENLKGVLCTDSGGAMWTDSMERGRWSFNSDATHWMPLPDPPKGE